MARRFKKEKTSLLSYKSPNTNYMLSLHKIFVYVISLPKTIWVNFRHLPLNQAIKLPIAIHWKTQIKIKGKINLLGTLNLAKIRIGFHTVPICNHDEPTAIYISRNSEVSFVGSAHIGRGSKIVVNPHANLIIGDNFAISACSQIFCHKKVIFGNDIQFSWDCLVMDSDTHEIYDEEGIIKNPPKEIIFGDKVWIGCKCIILKGAVIPSNCVIGASSLVCNSKLTPNTIIAGSPAKSVNHISGWKI